MTSIDNEKTNGFSSAAKKIKPGNFIELHGSPEIFGFDIFIEKMLKILSRITMIV